MTLLAGLSEGLIKTAEGMNDDSMALQHQLDLLDSVLPNLKEQHSRLVNEESELQAAANELADCDQEELEEARHSLMTLDEDIESKTRLISELQAQVQSADAQHQQGMERKQVCLKEIREAEKIRDECRGWTGNEVIALKSKVDALEAEYGWMVTGVSKGTTTSMSYRSDLELVFDVSSFKTPGRHNHTQVNTQIDLWYIGENRELNPSPFTMEKKFFVDNIRDHCRGMNQASTTVRELLDTVSMAWTRALNINDQIQSLSLAMPTETTKTSDNSILVTSSLLLKDIATKVYFKFQLAAESTAEGLRVDVQPKAEIVYGHGFNEDKMTEYVRNRIVDGEGDWAVSVMELAEKLIARSRK